MKKKNIIIPLVCLVLSFAAILSMTFLRTGFLYKCVSYTGNIQQVRASSEIWYKFNPNINSLAAYVKAHNPHYFLIGLDDINNYDKDFFKDEAAHCEELLARLNNGEQIAEQGAVVVMKNTERPQYIESYVLSLYLAGETEKALTYYQSYLESISKEDLTIALLLCKDFPCYVYNDSPSEKDKESITEFVMAQCERAKNGEEQGVSAQELFKQLIAPIEELNNA